MPSHLITGTTGAAHDENFTDTMISCLKVVKLVRNFVTECKWKSLGFKKLES